MPCTAFAYMSEMMYLEITSAALRRPGIAGEAAAFRRGAERQHNWVFLPQRVVLPHLCRADREALLRHPPLLVDLLAVEPAQEIFRCLLVLAIGHDHVGLRHMPAELAGRPLGQGGVKA